MGYLQEERRTKIEQFKSSENIIASEEINKDEASQLRKLYIIKLKRDMCMLETKIKNFSDGKKLHGVKNRNQRI